MQGVECKLSAGGYLNEIVASVQFCGINDVVLNLSILFTERRWIPGEVDGLRV